MTPVKGIPILTSPPSQHSSRARPLYLNAKLAGNVWTAIVVALAATVLVPAAANCKENVPAKHPPKVSHIVADDGVKNPTFAAFRMQLLEAVKKRDKDWIESILSPGIEYALGGGKGIKAFNENWENLSASSEFWPKMQKILGHGAQFDAEAGEFHAPALAFEDSHSELPQCLVWNKAAAIYKEAKGDSPIVQQPYDEQLTILEPPDGAPITTEWVKVQSIQGKEGYMKSSDVYSAYDDFAVFKKVHQKWCLSWFGFAGL